MPGLVNFDIITFNNNQYAYENADPRLSAYASREANNYASLNSEKIATLQRLANTEQELWNIRRDLFSFLTFDEASKYFCSKEIPDEITSWDSRYCTYRFGGTGNEFDARRAEIAFQESGIVAAINRAAKQLPQNTTSVFVTSMPSYSFDDSSFNLLWKNLHDAKSSAGYLKYSWQMELAKAEETQEKLSQLYTIFEIDSISPLKSSWTIYSDPFLKNKLLSLTTGEMTSVFYSQNGALTGEYLVTGAFRSLNELDLEVARNLFSQICSSKNGNNRFYSDCDCFSGILLDFSKEYFPLANTILNQYEEPLMESAKKGEYVMFTYASTYTSGMLSVKIKDFAPKSSEFLEELISSDKMKDATIEVKGIVSSLKTYLERNYIKPIGIFQPTKLITLLKDNQGTSYFVRYPETYSTFINNYSKEIWPCKNLDMIRDAYFERASNKYKNYRMEVSMEEFASCYADYHKQELTKLSEPPTSSTLEALDTQAQLNCSRKK
uniref:hypothetical protein n=1 Tax=Roseivirga sp. TaxID=1964215 RepID=UPI0040486644